MHVGEKIRLARKSQYLSQKKLAQLANVSPSYLCDIERGRSDGSIRVLHNIAQALHMELAELLKTLN